MDEPLVSEGIQYILVYKIKERQRDVGVWGLEVFILFTSV
jgi:hypothetical protein